MKPGIPAAVRCPARPPDWDGDADSRHRALLQSLGEEEVDEGDLTLSTLAQPSPASTASALTSIGSDFTALASHADWDGDVDSRHRALLQALGEEEVDEGDLTPSTLAQPSPASTASAVTSIGTDFTALASHADWDGDADSRHRALLKALGEEEVDEGDLTLSTLAQTSPASTASAATSIGSDFAALASHADWDGDTDSRHRALLQALGEEEVDGGDLTLSTLAQPSPASTASEVTSIGSDFTALASHADWDGDADSRHRALLQALGEEEVDEGDLTLSTLAQPSPASTASAATSIGSDFTALASHADWDGDADSRHRALLQALGEEEVDGGDFTLSTLAQPSPASTASVVTSIGSDFTALASHADWDGDADSRHRALLQVLGEEEVDEGDLTLSTLAQPSPASTASAATSIGSDFTALASHADWDGDADSRHRALLQALGEEEVDGGDLTLSTLAQPSPASTASVVTSIGSDFTALASHADWDGDADSRHRALLQALGEEEVDEGDLTLSTLAQPSPASTASVVTSIGSDFTALASHADWDGDADSRHRALLQALGEEEVDEGDLTLSTLAQPSPASTASAVTSIGTDFTALASHADWDGDADSRHRALLQALGEEEVDGGDLTLSTLAQPSPASTASAATSIGSDFTALASHGDADSRHRALLQALGEEEVDEGDLTLSTLAQPSPASTASAATSIGSDFTALASHADWDGDADSRHRALLQALGEEEPL